MATTTPPQHWHLRHCYAKVRQWPANQNLHWHTNPRPRVCASVLASRLCSAPALPVLRKLSHRPGEAGRIAACGARAALEESLDIHSKWHSCRSTRHAANPPFVSGLDTRPVSSACRHRWPRLPSLVGDAPTAKPRPAAPRPLARPRANWANWGPASVRLALARAAGA